MELLGLSVYLRKKTEPMLSQGDLRAKVAEGKQRKDPEIKLSQDPLLDFSINKLVCFNYFDYAKLLVIHEWWVSVRALDGCLCHSWVDLILGWLRMSKEQQMAQS